MVCGRTLDRVGKGIHTWWPVRGSEEYVYMHIETRVRGASTSAIVMGWYLPTYRGEDGRPR